MTITTRTLILIVMLAALLSGAVTYTVSSMTKPEPAVASDAQIVRAIERTIGKYDHVGNSLRTSNYKQLREINQNIEEMCRALAEQSYAC